MATLEQVPAREAVGAVLAAALDCVVCMDGDGRVWEWNRSSEKTFGWTRAEAIGCDLADLIIPPELRDSHRAGRDRFLKTGKAQVIGRRVEVPALRKDGTRLLVELSVSALETQDGTMFAAHLRDITRERMDARRRESQYEVASLLSEATSLPEVASRLLQALAKSGAWRFATLWLVENDMVRCNATWRAPDFKQGRFATETISRTFALGEGLPGRISQSGHPEWIEDISDDKRFVRTAAAIADGLHGALAFPLMAAGKVVGVVELFSTEILTIDSELLAASMTSGRNIGQFMQRTRAVADLETRTREAQEQRRIAEEQRSAAEAANVAKDRFLATLSHELRTPLTPVLLWASAVVEDPDVPEDVKKGIQMVRKNIALEARLIDDLLDLSRLSHGKVRIDTETCDVHELLRNVGAMLEPEYQVAKHSLQWDLWAENAQITGNATRLQQVFWNLLRNAAKFTPRGGLVRVRTWNEDGALFVEVSDTGIGIEPENLERVFNPFEQEEREGSGGLGLGLAIARKLVQLHSGTLTASSQGPGCGATFHVRLPCCARELTPVKEQPAPQPARVLRVLVVEDHESTRETLATLLKRTGHQVRLAGSLSEAREVFDQQPFDLLIADLGLPDGSGYDLMREIRTRSMVPAIALSGFGDVEDVRRSIEVGFTRHLIKPIDVEELKWAIADLPYGERNAE